MLNMTEKKQLSLKEILPKVSTLTPNHLESYRFPREHPSNKSDSNEQRVKARVYNYPEKYYSVIPGPGKRNCARCHLVYNIRSTIEDSKCSYHPSSLTDSPSKLRYSCCEGDVDAPPCQNKEFHVSDDVDLDDMSGFYKVTDSGHDGRTMAVLDCQFVYTTHGLEVGAFTIMHVYGGIDICERVKPANPIIDYRENVTGLTKDDFRYDNQFISMSEFKSFIETNLFLPGYYCTIIGHGLAETFLRIRLIHNDVIDTAILFEETDGKNPSFEVLSQKYLGDLDLSDVTKIKSLQNSIKTLKLIKVAQEKEMSYKNVFMSPNQLINYEI